MRWLNFLWRLSWKQKVLLVLIFLLLGIMRVVILLIPFRYYVKVLLQAKRSQTKFMLTPKKFGYARAIGRLTALAAKFTPWESKCLVQGLTVRFLLRALHIPSCFYIGVGKDEEQQFAAHAWVNCNNFTLIGGAESFKQFKIISQFEDF
jgi:hypothetical protein